MVENLSKAIQILDKLIQKAENLNPQEHTIVPPSRSKTTQDAGSAVAASKPSKAAKAEAGMPTKEPSEMEMFAKAKLVVGLVRQIEEVANSDKLYRCQVQVAPDQTRQIIAGLRKHISKEDLLGRTVAVVANLKAAKLAGETSEGMILAAVCKDEQYDHGELVKPLQPPAHASPGEPIHLEGSSASEVHPKECKQWKKLLTDLAVRSSIASFKGKSLTCDSGFIQADASIPEGASIS